MRSAVAVELDISCCEGLDILISVKDKLDLSLSTSSTEGLEGSTLTIVVIKGSAFVESAAMASSLGVVPGKVDKVYLL